MEFPTGALIRDRYVLEEPVGTGGFSTVWRASVVDRDSDVALKLPRVGTHDRDEVHQRFQREHRLLEPFGTGLSHATIVRYIDGDPDVEPWYLAFEFLPGDPLVETFATGALGSGLRRRIATDLAETLDFLHRNDVVYLDLKPENLILRQSGQPVLVDFNAAIDRSETPRTVFESDQFKAPELLVNRMNVTAGPRSDVFSWGKLAFYLLTGMKVSTENVPPEGLDPRDHGSTVSGEFATVIRRATVPDPSGRYADGTALAAAVAHAIGRGRRVVLTHVETGLCGVLTDGDGFGRASADGPIPWLVVADSDGHLSPQHAQIRYVTDGWHLEDTSVNGTYVGDGGRWRYALSENAYDRQVSEGRLDPEEPRPPSTVALSDGAPIAPVHPRYGIGLRVDHDA